MNLSPQAGLLLELINLHNRIQKRVLGPMSIHGISLTEYLVLSQIDNAPDKKIRRIDLANQVGLSASGITRMLEPMQKTGLITKEEAARDARVSLVMLTSAGGRILNEAHATFDQLARDMLGQLSAEDQAALSRLADIR